MLVMVTLKPNSKHREEVVAGDDGSLMVFTKSPAGEGRANEAAARLLAKYYGVSTSRIRLVRGHTSKHKVFEVDTPQELTDDEIVTVILPIVR